LAASIDRAALGDLTLGISGEPRTILAQLSRTIAHIERRLETIRAAAGLSSDATQILQGLRGHECAAEQELMNLKDALSAETAPNSVLAAGQAGSRNLFVIKPFKLNSYYRDAIRPTVVDIKYRILQPDESYSPGAFLQTIWEKIIIADFVISEGTKLHPTHDTI